MPSPQVSPICRCCLTAAGLMLGGVLSAPCALALETVTLTVEGVNNTERRDALIERLRAASLTAEVVDDDDIEEPVAQDVLGLALADYSRLVSILYTEGFFGPYVSILVDGREAADIDPFNPPSTITTVAILVEPGRRFRFGTARVAPLPADRPPGPLVSGFETGEFANSDLVGAAANAGVREWREEGHPKADVADQSIRAVHPESLLNVDITLAPGPRLRFGPLTIAGTSDVSNRRVRQIMGYPEGEIYSPEEIRDAVNRLRRTGVFRTVTLNEAEIPNADGTLDYTLTLIDEKKRRFGFSAEYATLDGFTIGGFWLHRNLFGGAERFRIDGQISNIGGTVAEGFDGGSGTDYSLGFRATRPGTFGADNDLFFFGNVARTDDPEYLEDEATIGLGVSRYFSDELYGEAALGLRYSRVEDVFGDREFNHVVLPGRLTWDTRNNEGDASAGNYDDLMVTPYIGYNGSESGVYGELDTRAYWGIDTATFENRYILATRVQLGSVVGTSIENTPPDFLFYSGGGDTVRGQSYQSLGVAQENGRQSGGRSFAGAQTELRTWITDSIGAVVFYDIGIVGPDALINDKARMQSGTGIGARLGTPIGPIRLDLATPIAGERDAFSTVELYIGIGQAF
jgi:translocation and assembly module TamA